MPTLTLIRGLPGSGKSTLAKAICATTQTVHTEADEFMIDDDGNYSFDPKRLQDCHQRCQSKTIMNITIGNNVVVSNTFTQLWEMQWYIDLAKEYHLQLNILECTATYNSVHNVPEEAIERMKDRWERCN